MAAKKSSDRHGTLFHPGNVRYVWQTLERPRSRPGGHGIVGKAAAWVISAELDVGLARMRRLDSVTAVPGTTGFRRENLAPARCHKPAMSIRRCQTERDCEKPRLGITTILGSIKISETRFAETIPDGRSGNLGETARSAQRVFRTSSADQNEIEGRRQISGST